MFNLNKFSYLEVKHNIINYNRFNTSKLLITVYYNSIKFDKNSIFEKYN